jgi:hypothetical protein
VLHPPRAIAVRRWPTRAGAACGAVACQLPVVEGGQNCCCALPLALPAAGPVCVALTCKGQHRQDKQGCCGPHDGVRVECAHGDLLVG